MYARKLFFKAVIRYLNERGQEPMTIPVSSNHKLASSVVIHANSNFLISSGVLSWGRGESNWLFFFNGFVFKANK